MIGTAARRCCCGPGDTSWIVDSCGTLTERGFLLGEWECPCAIGHLEASAGTITSGYLCGESIYTPGAIKYPMCYQVGCSNHGPVTYTQYFDQWDLPANPPTVMRAQLCALPGVVLCDTGWTSDKMKTCTNPGCDGGLRFFYDQSTRCSEGWNPVPELTVQITPLFNCNVVCKMDVPNQTECAPPECCRDPDPYKRCGCAYGLPDTLFTQPHVVSLLGDTISPDGTYRMTEWRWKGWINGRGFPQQDPGQEGTDFLITIQVLRECRAFTCAEYYEDTFRYYTKCIWYCFVREEYYYHMYINSRLLLCGEPAFPYPGWKGDQIGASACLGGTPSKPLTGFLEEGYTWYPVWANSGVCNQLFPPNELPYDPNKDFVDPNSTIPVQVVIS